MDTVVRGLLYAGWSLFLFECSVNKGNVEVSFLFFGRDFKQHKSWTPPAVHLTSDLESDQVKRTLASFFSHITAVQVESLQVSSVRMKEERVWFTSVQCSAVQFCPTQQAAETNQERPFSSSQTILHCITLMSFPPVDTR